MLSEGPQRIREIIEWGAQFDKDPNGDYSLGKEGGHSVHRILHHKDVTGKGDGTGTVAKNKKPSQYTADHSLVCGRYYHTTPSWDTL